MKQDELEKIINEAFDNRQNISNKSDKKILDAISETINLTDSGIVRVANKIKDVWTVNKLQFFQTLKTQKALIVYLNRLCQVLRYNLY